MRALWNLLEIADRAVFRALDERDRWLGRAPLLERTKEATKDIKPPQRVITLDV